VDQPGRPADPPRPLHPEPRAATDQDQQAAGSTDRGL